MDDEGSSPSWPSTKAWSFPRLMQAAAGPLAGPGRTTTKCGTSTLLEALDAMKRCNSDNHFGCANDDVSGTQSPDTTLAAFHSKQCSQESLESAAEELLRAMKSSFNLGDPCPLAPGHASAESQDRPELQAQPQRDTVIAASSSSSSSKQQQSVPEQMHNAEQHLLQPSSSTLLESSLPESQHKDNDDMGPQRAQRNVEPAAATTCQATSNEQAAMGLPTTSLGFRPGTSPAMNTPVASAYLAPSHPPRAKVTNPYHIPRSQTSSPTPLPSYHIPRSQTSVTPPPSTSAMPTSAPAPSSALTPGSFETSSSDECEEATRRLTAAYPRLHATSHERNKSWSAFGGRGSQPEGTRLLRSQEASLDGSSSLSLSLSLEEAELLERRRNGRGNYHLTGQAAAELLLRLNHARQTVDFVKRQAALFSPLNRASMDVWEALDMLEEMQRQTGQGSQVEAAMSPKDHAFQTAELCRLAHPDQDWLHLVGLLHGLGRLLGHRTFGSQPDWATLGESFPLGCRFDPSLQGAQFFSVNPDRRRRMYSTPLGIYPPACGLRNVYMSWSAAEYLYLALLLNDLRLPQEALFMIRYQTFTSLTSGNGAYRQLLSPADEALLPLLASFQQLCVQRRVTLPPDKTRSREEQQRYYSALVDKYLGQGRRLSW